MGNVLLALAISVALLGNALAASLDGWRVSDYQKVTRTEDAEGLLLTVTQASGGLVLRREASQGETFELVVAGQNISGVPPTLRLLEDEKAPQYLAAPNGVGRFVVSAKRSMEVMIYGDAAFAYRLTRAELRPCPECRTPAQKLSAAERLAPEWRPELLGSPEVRTEGEGLIVAGSGAAQEGLYLRRAIDSGRSYRLILNGHASQGQTVLRVKQGSQEPRWLPAPQGEKTQVTISNADLVEALIYSPSEFVYHLGHVELRECPECLTDDALRDRILSEVPDLRELLANDRLTAADRLLGWSSHVVDQGQGIAQFEALSRAYPSMSASQIFQDVWLADAGGGSCSAFAVFYQKVLALFGYRAFTMDVGYPGAITHVTTILEHDQQFYLFDPTFNAVHQDGAGRYVDLQSVLREPNRAVFRERPVQRTMMWPSHRLQSAKAELSRRGYPIERCDRNDGAFLLCRDVPYDSGAIRWGWSQTLTEKGLAEEPDLIVALARRRVITVSGTAGPETRARFVSAMKAAHLRLE